jgi:hypothetical protein
MMLEDGVDIGTWGDGAADIEEIEHDSQPLNTTATRCGSEEKAGNTTQMHNDAIRLKHAPFHCECSPVPALSSRDTRSGEEYAPVDCGTYPHPKHSLQSCCYRQTHP